MKTALLPMILAFCTGLAIGLAFLTGFMAGVQAQKDLVPANPYSSGYYSYDYDGEYYENHNSDQ